MGLFSSIFGKKREEFPDVNDFSSVATDMHSHLIPGIDDGVQTMDEAIQMITELSNLGYKKLITTPHIMSDYYKNTPDTILKGLDQVREAIHKKGIPVTIEAAAEYYLDEVFVNKVKSDNNLLMFGGKYLLFEVSYINPPDNVYNVIFDLTVRGITPILAHPERYPFWATKFDEYYRLKEAGALFQLNTNSLVGYYGAGPKTVSERLIDENMIDFIGTDLHGQRHLDALRKVNGQHHFRKLLSQRLLNASIT